MREADLEKKCIKHAKGCGFLMPKWASPGTGGVHDRLLIAPAIVHPTHGVTSRAVIIPVEFKTPMGRLTKLQQHWHRKMDGFLVEHYVIDNYDDFVALTIEVLERVEES